MDRFLSEVRDCIAEGFAQGWTLEEIYVKATREELYGILVERSRSLFPDLGEDLHVAGALRTMSETIEHYVLGVKVVQVESYTKKIYNPPCEECEE